MKWSSYLMSTNSALHLNVLIYNLWRFPDLFQCGCVVPQTLIFGQEQQMFYFLKKNKDVYIFNRSLTNLDYKTYCYCPTTEDVLNTIFLQPLSLLRYRASNVTRPHTKNIAQSPSSETQGVTWVWTWYDLKPPSFSTVQKKKV